LAEYSGKKVSAEIEKKACSPRSNLVVAQFSCLVAFLRKNEFLKRMPVSSQKGSRQA